MLFSKIIKRQIILFMRSSHFLLRNIIYKNMKRAAEGRPRRPPLAVE